MTNRSAYGSRVNPVDLVAEPPTERQLAVLGCLANGMSMREIGKALGIGSTNAVNDHITSLERRALVERIGNGSRKPIRVTDAGLRTVGPCDCMKAMVALISESGVPDVTAQALHTWARGFRFCPECGRRQAPPEEA